MFDEQLPMTFSDVAAKAVLHPGPKARRDTIKAAGGPEYEALLDRERLQKARHRKQRGRQPYDLLNTKKFQAHLCGRARRRGRKRGLEATIRPADVNWPTHCPVLGIELDYPERNGMRGAQAAQPNWPSLDRWDSTKGYVPGNVFVISYRANTLKNSATYEEILKVAKYLSRRPR